MELSFNWAKVWKITDERDVSGEIAVRRRGEVEKSRRFGKFHRGWTIFSLTWVICHVKYNIIRGFFFSFWPTCTCLCNTHHTTTKKVFKMLGLDGFRGPDDKKVSIRVHNTNSYKYKGPPDHSVFNWLWKDLLPWGVEWLKLFIYIKWSVKDAIVLH